MATAWDVSTAVYAEKYKSVVDKDTYPRGITFSSNGTKMYIVGTENNRVYQYTLSTAWDVSTATYAEYKAISAAQDTAPTDVAFNSDGTKMYIMGNATDTVYQYTLSTAWNVSTATYAEKYKDVEAQDTASRGVAFSPNGTKMYTVGTTNNRVYQYTLSTAWDVSTATYVEYKSVNTQDTSPRDVAFNSDGTKMYVMGNATDTVYQYTVSTPWNVSTATYAEKSKDVEAQATSPRGIAFNSDGTKMYIMGYDTDTVYQYTLPVVVAVNALFFGANF